VLPGKAAPAAPPRAIARNGWQILVHAQAAEASPRSEQQANEPKIRARVATTANQRTGRPQVGLNMKGTASARKQICLGQVPAVRL